MYIVNWTQAINSSGVDTLARISTDNLTSPWSPVGVSVTNSPTLNRITTISTTRAAAPRRLRRRRSAPPRVVWQAASFPRKPIWATARNDDGPVFLHDLADVYAISGGARSATLTATDQDGNVGLRRFPFGKSNGGDAGDCACRGVYSEPDGLHWGCDFGRNHLLHNGQIGAQPGNLQCLQHTDTVSSVETIKPLRQPAAIPIARCFGLVRHPGYYAYLQPAIGDLRHGADSYAERWNA